MPSSYYTNAASLALAMKDVYGKQGFEATGHSLGGGLAATASALTGAKASTFNAAGVHDNTLAQFSVSAKQADAVDNFRVKGEALTSLQESKYAVPALATALTLPVKNALGIAQGLDPAKWVSFAQGKGPMPTPKLTAEVTRLPAAVGKQNDLPAVDAAGNEVPWTKDVGGIDRHGIDYSIRGLEKQRSDDIRAIADQMR